MRWRRPHPDIQRWHYERGVYNGHFKCGGLKRDMDLSGIADAFCCEVVL